MSASFEVIGLGDVSEDRVCCFEAMLCEETALRFAGKSAAWSSMLVGVLRESAVQVCSLSRPSICKSSAFNTRVQPRATDPEYSTPPCPVSSYHHMSEPLRGGGREDRDSRGVLEGCSWEKEWNGGALESPFRMDESAWKKSLKVV